ncbi:MAG TPA: DUF370 domain-containing protein [Candidatus Merdivicinus intestinavium]|nr:DUF370 domain-containing protein [Candidatus Merdivicinus intestinavium]
MYLHIGNEKILSEKDIIGVFDIENASVSKLTKEFLSKAQKGGEVVSMTSDIPKSIIVWEHGGERRLYLSQLAPATLYKRSREFG